jgi:hypothetical protein
MTKTFITPDGRKAQSASNCRFIAFRENEDGTFYVVKRSNDLARLRGHGAFVFDSATGELVRGAQYFDPAEKAAREHHARLNAELRAR